MLKNSFGSLAGSGSKTSSYGSVSVSTTLVVQVPEHILKQWDTPFTKMSGQKKSLNIRVRIRIWKKWFRIRNTGICSYSYFTFIFIYLTELWAWLTQAVSCRHLFFRCIRNYDIIYIVLCRIFWKSENYRYSIISYSIIFFFYYIILLYSTMYCFENTCIFC
jgi:hypothetical protein